MRRYKGFLVGGRVYIPDHEEARRVWSLGFFGKPLGVDKPKRPDFDSPLLLDPLEALYLLEKGVIEVYHRGEPLGSGAFRELIRDMYPSLDLKYMVYKDLRDRGFVVISGLKFGVDFAVYKRGPGIEHAPYLVDVIEAGSMVSGDELVRAGRLATSVRKRFVYAVVDGDKKSVRYLMFKWFKP